MVYLPSWMVVLLIKYGKCLGQIYQSHGWYGKDSCVWALLQWQLPNIIVGLIDMWSFLTLGALVKETMMPGSWNISLVGSFKYFFFHHYLGKWSSLTNIFQMGWNHHLDLFINGCFNWMMNHIINIKHGRKSQFPSIEKNWVVFLGTR